MTAPDSIPASGPGPGPLVSILIPCYNAGAWISQSIESALRQSYPRTEIIVLDDGSTDESPQVIRSFGSRIRHERQPQSGGNRARNRLLELARGDWLQYLDADDCLLPDKIHRQTAFLEARNYDLDVVYSPIIVRNESTQEEVCFEMESAADLPLHFIRWAPINTNGLLWRRQALADVGGWNPDQACCQEHELLLRFMIAGRRAALFNEPGVIYRRHAGGSVSTRDPLRVLRTQMTLLDRLESHLTSKGGPSPEHLRALRLARFEGARRAYPHDRALAQLLFQRSVPKSRPLLPHTTALPFRFQIAAQLLGLDGAEFLANAQRRLRSL